MQTLILLQRGRYSITVRNPFQHRLCVLCCKDTILSTQKQVKLMVFLPVCVFQFTHPHTFSPYIFNAKTLTQQLNTLPANIPVIVYPPHLSSLILIINAALPFPSIVYSPHLSNLTPMINAALPFPSIVYPPHLSNLTLIIK